MKRKPRIFLAAILCIASLAGVGVPRADAAVEGRGPQGMNEPAHDPDAVIAKKDGILRSGDWEFRVLEDGTAELTGYWSMKALTAIPAEIAGFRVSAIGDMCFSNRAEMCFYTDEYPDYFREMIRSVVIPEGVVSIGDYAFENCFSLVDVTFPASLERIGRYAFDGCVLMMKADLPQGLTAIGDYAFRDCRSLTGVSLSGSVRSLGDNPFAGCVHLNRITLPQDHPDLVYENGLLYNRAERKLICCTKAAWDHAPAWPADLRAIGASAFARAAFEELTLPASLREIGDYAFSDCVRLERLVLPAGVETIGGNPVRGCTALEALVLPEGQDRFAIMDDALFDRAEGRLIAYLKPPVPIDDDFSRGGRGEALPQEVEVNGTRMRLIDIESSWSTRSGYEAAPAYEVPSGTAAVGAYAFYGSRITGIVLPDSVTGIGEGAFMRCFELTACAIPPQVRLIPDHLFHDCWSLISVTLPDGVTEVGAFAFYAAGSFDIALPDTVTELGRFAFARSHVGTVKLNGGLTRIPRGAFSESRVEAVTIPESITDIGEEAFAFCYCMDAFTLPSRITEIPAFCFFACNLCEAVIPEGVTWIGDYAFSSDLYIRNSLESIVLPQQLRFLGSHAFMQSVWGGTIDVPGSLLVMGDGAFFDCRPDSVHLSEGITAISAKAFAFCQLTSVEIPDSVRYIGDQAFACYTGTRTLTAVRLPDHRLEIEGNPFCIRGWSDREDAFQYPEVLLSADHPNLRFDGGLLIDVPERRVLAWLPQNGEKHCVVPDGIEAIGTGAFCSADLSGGITLPDSLRRIEANAFDGAALTEIRFPAGLEVIGSCAFYGSCLEEASLPDGLREIGAGAFDTGELTALTIPASVRKLGADQGSLKRLVFESGEVSVEGPVIAGYYKYDLEIVVPEDHPTLALVDGCLYSRQDDRLLLYRGDGPIRDGTRVIEEGAISYNDMPLIPESVDRIGLYMGDWYYINMPACVYVVPGSPAEAFFEYGVYTNY